MQKITPFLWFDTELEEAVNFYVSVFKNSEIKNISRHGDQVFTASFVLNGVEFMGLNGGPLFTFNESVSFFVDCEDQAEVNELWDKLTADGGEASQCGWLKDKFGVSWQIIPKALGELLGDPDPEKSGRVMQAMLKMQKIEVDQLQAAYKGE